MFRIKLFGLSAVLLFLLGVLGLKMVEPGATWSDATIWTVTAFTTFGLDMFPPTNAPSKWFQGIYLFLSFLETGFALTIIIPPVNEWFEAPKKGLAKARVTRGIPLYILVDPVDWEKVLSVVVELLSKGPCTLVVVSESDLLTELPAHLRKIGVQLVRGSVRQRETFDRARIDVAKAVIVCASSYKDVDADMRTAGVVQIIKQYRSEVHTIVEIVCNRNTDLFEGAHGADARVVFDPTTLREVARLVKNQVGDTAVRIVANTCDEDQATELRAQLAHVGVQVTEDGPVVQIILPTNLDDPSGSDFTTKAALKRATVSTVALQLSVVSDDLFIGHNNIVCADRIMAQALVRILLHQDP